MFVGITSIQIVPCFLLTSPLDCTFLQRYKGWFGKGSSVGVGTIGCIILYWLIITTLVYTCSTDGSVVEFSPATREARVRFPVSAFANFLSTSTRTQSAYLQVRGFFS